MQVGLCSKPDIGQSENQKQVLLPDGIRIKSKSLLCLALALHSQVLQMLNRSSQRSRFGMQSRNSAAALNSAQGNLLATTAMHCIAWHARSRDPSVETHVAALQADFSSHDWRAGVTVSWVRDTYKPQWSLVASRESAVCLSRNVAQMCRSNVTGKLV